MKVNAIIGIDPGAAGGICMWRPGRLLKLYKMPKDIRDLKDWLEYVKTICSPLIFLEKLSVRPDDVAVIDGNANMGKLYRIQKMMANYERLKSTITFCDIPFILIHPISWQTKLKLRVQGEEKAERKRRYRDIASQLYPGVKQTMWSCDATLIMHFGRFILKNDKEWVRQNLPTSQHDKFF